MRFGRVVSLAVVAFLAMSAVPAFAACAFGCAGGYDAFSHRTEYLWPGQTVTWSTQAYTDRRSSGPSDGPFFAYLVERDESIGDVPRVEGGTRLALVKTGPSRHFSFEASVTFTVPPSTTLGSYAVEVCDDPCTTRLGYFGPTRVEVVSGDIEARLQDRIDNLSIKVDELRWSMGVKARRAAKGISKVLRVEMDVAEEELGERVSVLALKVSDLEKQLASKGEPEDDGEVSQSALSGAIVVLLLFGFLLRERSRNRRLPNPLDF
jgi:hypothetical protein